MQSLKNAWNIGAQYILTDWSLNIDIEESGKLECTQNVSIIKWNWEQKLLFS